MNAENAVSLAGGGSVRIRRLDDGTWEARRRHYWDDGQGFEEWVSVFADYDSAAAYAWSAPLPPGD